MPQSEEEKQKHEKMIAEWLAKGNKITVCPPGARTQDSKEMFNRWKGKPKKKVDKTEQYVIINMQVKEERTL